jgi:hypothetical protein
MCQQQHPHVPLVLLQLRIRVLLVGRLLLLLLLLGTSFGVQRGSKHACRLRCHV